MGVVPCNLRQMDSIRRYGLPPYRVALVHGGPGAAGEMAPVARELGRVFSVLEPLQMAYTIDRQVEELRAIIEGEAMG